MPIITRAKLCTSALLMLASVAQAEWTVDFSRRSSSVRAQDLRAPASTTEVAVPIEGQQNPSFFESLFQGGEATQEIVVLSTDKGFVPSTIRVKKGQSYQLHIVNVNDKEKNISFVLDSFSEHHATYYGKIKTFTIRPQKEGVFKFVSPETSAQGKLVVYPATMGTTEHRSPAAAMD